jgi:hypothetical protein
MVGELSATKTNRPPGEGLPRLVIEDAAILKQIVTLQNHPNIKLVSPQLTIALILNPQAWRKVHDRFCAAEID